MKWKLELKLANSGFLITVSILIGMGVLSYQMFRNSLQKELLTKHTYKVLQTSKDLLSTLKDAETSQRGYIITATESFLVPYELSIKRCASLFIQLKSLTIDNVSQQKRCDALNLLFKAKYASLQKEIDIRRYKGAVPAINLVKEGEGKILMEDIRTIFTELDTEEQKLLILREHNSNKIENFTKRIILISIGMGIIIFIIIHFIIRKQIMLKKKNEDELFIRREWFTQTLESLSDGVISTDTKGIITMINKAACLISGWREEDAIGQFIDVVFEISNEGPGLKKLSPTMKAIATNHIVVLASHTILKRKDGAILFIDESAAPIHNKESDIIGAILIFRDITEKKIAEKKIIASNIRFTKIFDLSPVAICINNLLTGKLLYANDAFCKTMIFKKEDIIGRTIADLHILDPDAVEKIKGVINNPDSGMRDFELNVMKSTHQCIEVLCSCEPIEIDDDMCLISSFTDITERKIIQKNLQILHYTLETKNKELTDSIYYAKNIQNAFLPEHSQLSCIYPDSFILYKPKDIVCGDFYWLKELNGKIILAVADCTGHGVPGALMSMIGLQKLNDASLYTQHPSDILKKLNISIKACLNQNDNIASSMDGMDIVLCTIDSPKNISINDDIVLRYAGANRPLFIIRNGQTEVEEIKGTKKAIGGFTENDQHFDTHEVILHKNDSIYLFSDGYADTFGGDTDKKLMIKNFKKLLISLQNKTMPEQGEALDSFIEMWKGGTEQVDDILVIGIRL